MLVPRCQPNNDKLCYVYDILVNDEKTCNILNSRRSNFSRMFESRPAAAAICSLIRCWARCKARPTEEAKSVRWVSSEPDQSDTDGDRDMDSAEIAF